MTLLQWRGISVLQTYFFFQHKLSKEDVLRGGKEQAICDVAYEVAVLAREHLHTVSVV